MFYCLLTILTSLTLGHNAHVTTSQSTQRSQYRHFSTHTIIIIIITILSICLLYFTQQNASWIGFGLCTVFVLLTIILTVRASKHFRRFHRSDNFRDSGRKFSWLIYDLIWDAIHRRQSLIINLCATGLFTYSAIRGSFLFSDIGRHQYRSCNSAFQMDKKTRQE
jgi:amino acid transporter